MHSRLSGAIIAAMLFLIGCGGGDGGTPTANPILGGSSTTPPTSTQNGTSSGTTSGGGTSGDGRIPNTGSTSPGAGTGSTTSGGSSSIPTPTTGSSSGTPSTPTPTSTNTVAMVVAYPQPADGMRLVDLNDNGHAAGTAGPYVYGLPMSVSTNNHHVANADNFGDLSPWTSVGGNNSAGVVAGATAQSERGARVAWIWDGAKRTALPLPNDVNKSALWTGGIDDNGRVAVQLYDGTRLGAAYIAAIGTIGNNGNYQFMAQVLGAGESTYVGRITNSGIVVGWAELAPTASRIFLWRPNSSVTTIADIDLLTCGCRPGAANNRGDLIIIFDDRIRHGTIEGQPPVHGELFTGSSRTRLPALDASSHEYSAINDQRDMVGNYGSGPFVVLGGRIHDLNAYANSAAFGWRFETASLMNNRRQVTGEGMSNGQRRWYLLTLR